jgi:hypothetical protein
LIHSLTTAAASLTQVGSGAEAVARGVAMAASVPTPVSLLAKPVLGLFSLVGGGWIGFSSRGRSRWGALLLIVALVVLAPRRAVRDALRAVRARIAARRGIVYEWPDDEESGPLAELREVGEGEDGETGWSSDEAGGGRRRRRARFGGDDEMDSEDEEEEYAGARTPGSGRRRSARRRPRLFVVAKHDFQARAPDELTFGRGDPFLVLDRSDGDWWRVESSTGARGLIPASYCRIRRSGNPGARSALGMASDDEQQFERRI